MQSALVPFALALLVSVSAGAATRYVDVNSGTPLAPYTTWATAADTIQKAVDAAAPGDDILVTNGVYATGGRAVHGIMTNRVAVDKPLTLRSVNGPKLTVIRGYQLPGTTNGDGAIRCVFLTNGTFLSGFTLEGGATRSGVGDFRYENSGGGLLGWSTAGAIVSNCVFKGNSADYGGGGAALATLLDCALIGNQVLDIRGGGGGATGCALTNCVVTGNSVPKLDGGGVSASVACNCVISGNTAASGGGASRSTLYSCTVTGNRSTRSAGGIIGGASYNSIVYYNAAGFDTDNYTTAEATQLHFCCTTPMPPSGIGNFEADPLLASSSHLSASSPCRGAGNVTYAAGVDIDSEPWGTPPDVGCDQFLSGSVTGLLAAVIVVPVTHIAVGYELEFESLIYGRVSSSFWDFGDGTVVSNRPYASHVWSAPGEYTVRLRAFNDTHAEGVVALVAVQVSAQPVHYVSLASPAPTPPYASWDTAATNIQDAVDSATLPGSLVLVSNGVFSTGAREAGGMSNRLVVTKPIIVRSLNGPSATTISGYQVPATRTGPAAVRCVYLADGVRLSGFTLTQGATRSEGDMIAQRSGGGAWCQSRKAVLVNCVISDNAASYFGGGSLSGTLNHCVLTGNSANSGGGACYTTLNNCAVGGNSAAYGGGVSYSTARNSIIYHNVANASYLNFMGGTFNFCCTTPLPAGPGNFTNAPLFVETNSWANLRLQSDSPCINAGLNAFAPAETDLDGLPRIVGGTVDPGPYEFQNPGSTVSYAWLQKFGLPTSGAADLLDLDQDGHNNYQEWLAWTDPTNAASALRLEAKSAGLGVTLSWFGAPERIYVLERSATLPVTVWNAVLRTNYGQAGTLRYLAPTNSAAAFYRVAAEQ